MKENRREKWVKNQVAIKNLSSVMIQNKNEIERYVESSLTNIYSMPLVKLVGGQTSSKGIVYVKGTGALFCHFCVFGKLSTLFMLSHC